MDILIGLVADSVNQGTTMTGMELQISGNGQGIMELLQNYTLMDARLIEVETHVTAIEEYLNAKDTIGNAAEEAQSIGDWGSEVSEIQTTEQATQALQVLNAKVNSSVALNNTSRLANFASTLTLTVTQNPLISAMLGYGFAGVSIVYGILQNLSLHQYYTHTLEDAIEKGKKLIAQANA